MHTCAALLLLATFDGPGLAGGSPRPDELLVTGFGSGNVHRYDAADGRSLGRLGPAGMEGVLGAAFGPDGGIHVCSEANGRVVRFDPVSCERVDDLVFDVPATAKDETGGLKGPASIVFGPGGFAYVASFHSDSVLRYHGETGVFDRVFVSPALGGLDGPDVGMAFGPDGDLYIPSFYSNEIKRYDGATGAFVGDLVAPEWADIARPRTVVFPGDGFAYVTCEGNDKVLRVDAATGQREVLELIRDDPETPVDETGGLDGPTGLAFGPDGLIFVASLQASSVLRYRRDGTFVDVFIASGKDGLDLPTFLTFRPGVRDGCGVVPKSTGRRAEPGDVDQHLPCGQGSGSALRR
ncbi:MAG: streptogramin lyase [Chlamydiales bacterium]|jgi:streptogramin lyase